MPATSPATTTATGKQVVSVATIGDDMNALATFASADGDIHVATAPAKFVAAADLALARLSPRLYQLNAHGGLAPPRAMENFDMSPISIQGTNITSADGAVLVAIGNALIAEGATTVASASTVTGATGTTTTSGAAAAAINYFPASAALAPFPSPDNSSIIVLNGVVSGAPYLRDSNGGIWTLAIVGGAGVPSLNGVAINTSGSGANITEMIIRDGAIWAEVATGQWQYFNNTMGGFYNGTLPAAGTAPASTAVATAVSTTLPTPTATPGGSSGRTLTVGTGQQYPTITAAVAALQAGDTISIAVAGIYNEAPPAITVPCAIVAAVPGVILDGTGLTASLARGKGLLVPCADFILTGVTVQNVAMDQTASQSTAGVRPDVGCGYFTTNNCLFEKCQNGVAGGGLPWVYTDNGSTFDSCGLADGASHNMYPSAGTVKVSLNGTISTNPVSGHAVKSRAPLFSWIGGSGNAANATILDLPDGVAQPAVVQNVAWTKAAASANYGVCGINTESVTNGTAALEITGGSIAALCQNPFIQSGGATVILSGVAMTGSAITANASNGGAVQGL